MSGGAALHEIVVVGGGAAGLELVTRLGRTLGRHKRANVTLVERSRTHLWKPLLHAVAAGSLDPHEHELNLMLHAHRNDFNNRLGEMVGLDRARRIVKVAGTVDEDGREVVPPREIHYDTLVIAVGSITNDFGTVGAAQYAVPLETQEQARRFNRKLLNACLRAQTQVGPVRPGQLHVAIIGAGATGTELAAELHHTVREVLSHGLDRVNPENDVRIILIEAAPRVVPALPERVSDATRALLERLGVEVRTSSMVREVRPDGVVLADGTVIAAELVVWAAGVKGPNLLRDLDGLEATRANQLVVLPTLQTSRDENVFAIGDCCACPRPGFTGPVPPRAQAAHQQASHMVGQIRRRLRGEALLPFAYRDFGSLVSLGKYSTVGNLMGRLVGKNMFIEGIFARMMYRALYKMHEHALYGTGRTAMTTLARVLTRSTGPQVKLH